MISRYCWLLSFAVLLLMGQVTLAQTQIYSRVKIYLNGHTLQQLARLGIETEHGLVKRGVFIETDLSAEEILKVQAAGYTTQTVINDVAKYYRDQNNGADAQKLGNRLCEPPQYGTPQNFHLGSMAGYLTYQEMLDNLDTMAAKFPNLISHRAVIDSTLPTVGGKYLYWTHITGSGGPVQKPQMLYTALHHAREPASLSQLVYYMYYLLENYNTDPEIKTLLDNVDLYFIPCVNPDGYVYNQTTNPQGGGMWRKNRVLNNDGTYGVDLNRNYGYNWGYDNLGSSPDPNDETFRGTAAFSEPEIKTVRNFAQAHNFRIALNYHTYGGYVVYPWGYEASLLTPDSNFFDRAGSFITSENRYIYGTGNVTVGYNTNGDSDDWMYGEQVAKPKVFSMTPEVGTSFWDPIANILPICRENLFQNIETARLLLPRAVVTDVNPVILPSATGYLKFDVTRLGLPDNIDYTLSIAATTPGINFSPASKTFTGMSLAELRTDSFAYTIDASQLVGNNVTVVTTISGAGYAYHDTFNKFYGGLSVVFDEPCDNLNHWITNGWGLTSAHQSTPTGFSDSPNGNYPDNSNLSIAMDTVIDLSLARQAYLTFYAKWNLETSFDYTQLSISTNNGNTWSPLCTQFTHTGGIYQATYEPIYDGYRDWVQEFVDLTEYVGHSIKLKFETVSDAAVNEDGFTFDDLKIWADNACIALPSAITNASTEPLYIGDTLRAQTSAGATYQWLLGGSPIAGATDSIYVATSTGFYSLITSNGNTCPVTSAVQAVTTLIGIGTLNANSFNLSVLPNPFIDNLQVELIVDNNLSTTLSINDLTGRLLAAKIIQTSNGMNDINWDLKNILVPGVYVLSAQSERGSSVTKIVKQ